MKYKFPENILSIKIQSVFIKKKKKLKMRNAIADYEWKHNVYTSVLMILTFVILMFNNNLLTYKICETWKIAHICSDFFRLKIN